MTFPSSKHKEGIIYEWSLHGEKIRYLQMKDSIDGRAPGPTSSTLVIF